MNEYFEFDASFVTFRFLVDGTKRITLDISPLDNIGPEFLADPNRRYFRFTARRLTENQIAELMLAIEEQKSP